MEKIIKRDGSLAVFDANKITVAITKCFNAIGKSPNIAITELTNQVVKLVKSSYSSPTVEDVQNLVEMVLINNGEYNAAKAYILYRENRNKERIIIKPEVKKAFELSAKYFPNPIQQFQYFNKYARFNYDRGRRETWLETVDREVSYLRELSQNKLSDYEYEEIRQYILELKVLPSMRSLAMAGEAARRDNTAIYNCSYFPIIDLKCFYEAVIILMAGCGVGYSVEKHNVDKLPSIEFQRTDLTPVKFIVPDSSEGWAEALIFGLNSWFDGYDVKFDYSQVRPAGTPLKIKGGRASGEKPLQELLENVKNIVLSRQGKKLRPIDAHDIMCWVANSIVAGGVRRSALISLFSYDDVEMLTCKDPSNFSFQKGFEKNTQRANANNSAVWTENITDIQILDLLSQMLHAGNGEPGIFSRVSAMKTSPARRNLEGIELGTNPCAEINLKPFQFCNLTTVISRKEDTEDTLLDKVRVATIIGTIQSMADYFPHLRPEWKKNAEDERLLGVSLSAHQDSPASRRPDVQRMLKYWAVEINERYAEKLGIKPSASITCVKPDGNSSVLGDFAFGLHERWSAFYERRVEVNVNSAEYKVMKRAGVNLEVKKGQTVENANTYVAVFPVKSPDFVTTRNDKTLVEQLDYWLQVKKEWCEHNPSTTIYYEPNEILALIAWISEHKNEIGGLSFYPKFKGTLVQMAYTEISEKEYNRQIANFPVIDWSMITGFEKEDLTSASQELACVSGQCEV